MTEIKVHAIGTMQSAGQLMVTFVMDGKVIPEFAAVARVEDRTSEEVLGYQRPEVRGHIKQITSYLDRSARPLMPTAIVLALTGDGVKFEPTGPALGDGTPGLLTIRYEEDGSQKQKPCFIVDGQQRLAGIRESSVDAFPMVVTGFFPDSAQEQLEQFILTNSPRPLPKSLIYRLLPETETTLPSALERRRLPATLLERLNSDSGSAFAGSILTPTTQLGRIRDNSVLRMLEASTVRGVLAGLNDGDGKEPDVEGMLQVLRGWWGAVAEAFPEAWALGPRQSRLTHGVGIVSMGAVMDVVCSRLHGRGAVLRDITQEMLAAELEVLKPVCAWTAGEWHFDEAITRPWNELENTSRDLATLSNYLTRTYLQGPKPAPKRPARKSR